MADNDPISSDSTPNKRRKLNTNDASAKAWNSDDDSGDDLTIDDYQNTIATIPATQKSQLQYPHSHFQRQFHSEIPSSLTAHHVTQPTQPFDKDATSKIQVPRSSPEYSSPDLLAHKQPPQPITRAPFAKPQSMLARGMAPPGTAYRAPLGIPRPQTNVPPVDDEDSEDDPPVHHSSDEETQGLSSNLKPTNFRKGGRGLDSTPNRSDRIVKESPRPAVPMRFETFGSLMDQFGHNSSPNSKRAADDMISAYGSTSRAPRPQLPKQTVPSRALPVHNAVAYRTLNDIDDYALVRKVKEIQEVYPHESIQRCMDALTACKGSAADAMDRLAADEEQDASGEDDDIDELASQTPNVRRGVAFSKTASSQTLSSQPVRPSAKQEVTAPSRTIAEKYASTQANRRTSQPFVTGPTSPPEEDVQPRRRLLQGRKPNTRSPTPPSSPFLKPAQPLQRMKNKQVITISDSDSEPEQADESDLEDATAETAHDRQLLKFFNECSIKDLADLSTQSEDIAKLVLDQRPFSSLETIRAISDTSTVKSGRKSKTKPVGDKIVEVCSEMLLGYDAVDGLVQACENMALPIQEALKGWGVGANDDGELQLMNLDEAHDSGIGTPTSSSAGDDGPISNAPKQKKSKGRFLGQPESMNPETPLKDYQLVGLNWLNLLWSKKLSCILADDMGLGKTCQVIAFLAHLQHLNVNGLHLVIVPGSTLENWLREFARFAPELRVVPYYGSQDERAIQQYDIEQTADSIDVVVTTYDIAVGVNDNKFLRTHVRPVVCIYDEAHALRNSQTKRYKQLTRIPSQFRVLLTGTPLQNNLQELISILAFIMPKMFEEKDEQLQYIFKHKASTKDADHAALLSQQRIARARSMMTPFILRRKKQQVLDLPTKHSRVEYCDMTASQAAYYAGLRETARNLLTNKDESKAGKKAGAQMLMTLRQAALHPLLALRIYDDKKIDKIVTELLKHPEYEGNDRGRTKSYLRGEHHQSFKGGDYGLHHFCTEKPYLKRFELKKQEWMDAGKIVKFRQLAKSFADNGDRMLVFSQFTTMMDILEAVLSTLDIKFMRLDGSTTMNLRQDMIDQFTNDEDIKIFMLSTRAGGAGINLACANKVIILDSGFNPQDDIQAENRAHRVGQTREVEVVRLVTRGTIEEQIYALGQSKLALDERVSGESGHSTDDDGEDKEKAGKQLVEKLFLESLKKEDDQKQDDQKQDAPVDLKDAFRDGLEGTGLKVASKQAQF